jgi:spore coat polysaccharide biosynthesis predicted glycosyltransferase SpsG
MASADLALTAAGSTCWELACLGVPALVVETADNQRWVAAVLAAAGAVERCGRWGDQDPSELAERVAALLADRVRLTAMGTAGRRLVDGRGADRVLKYCRASLEGRACE